MHDALSRSKRATDAKSAWLFERAIAFRYAIAASAHRQVEARPRAASNGSSRSRSSMGFFNRHHWHGRLFLNEFPTGTFSAVRPVPKDYLVLGAGIWRRR